MMVPAVGTVLIPKDRNSGILMGPGDAFGRIEQWLADMENIFS